MSSVSIVLKSCECVGTMWPDYKNIYRKCAVDCKLNEEANTFFDILHRDIGICCRHFFFNNSAINLLTLFSIKHKEIVFCFKSPSVGMSLIHIWSVVFIERNERYASIQSVCGMLVYR